MHKKILSKCATKLEKDAKKYSKEATHSKGKHKKEELVEKKEAMSASKDLKRRARSSHEF